MKQDQSINSILYILAFIALLYLAVPHIVECYESYARPWNTEHMTNADIDVKQEFHQNNPTVWEMFTETAVKSDKELTDILPGETVKPASSKTILPGVPTPTSSKTILPGVPTPTKNDAPEGPSNKKEVEPPIEVKDFERPEVPKGEAAVTRTMDPEVQKPKMKSEQKKPQEPPRKITKVSHSSQPTPMPQLAPSPNTQQIMGPRAPELDPNQPRPTDSGNGSKHGSGVYPSIYGPESLEPPGGGGDSSDPPPFDFIPAAEFPAGPLHPSPYLNDFSRMLKT
jgi:hypothetical protein